MKQMNMAFHLHELQTVSIPFKLILGWGLLRRQQMEIIEMNSDG
jgi:hypothetical protein